MYNGKNIIKATSQLISSYAFDTALNFICQNSDYGYELATTTSSDRANIGTGTKIKTGEYVADCYSNIYDLIGNCYGWTTEYSSNTNSNGSGPCVTRGGGYYYKTDSASHRGHNTTDNSRDYCAFRVQLYIK